jgi:hypothetical protein
MKQHITKEQLWELVGKQDEVLHAWCEKKGYCNKTESIPLLTIGQMIEFLGEDLYSIVFHNSADTFYYQVSLRGLSFIYNGTSELVNALWEATKHKLKQKQD